MTCLEFVDVPHHMVSMDICCLISLRATFQLSAS